jgi:hypothetical protein
MAGTISVNSKNWLVSVNHLHLPNFTQVYVYLLLPPNIGFDHQHLMESLIENKRLN